MTDCGTVRIRRDGDLLRVFGKLTKTMSISIMTRSLNDTDKHTLIVKGDHDGDDDEKYLHTLILYNYGYKNQVIIAEDFLDV